MYIFAYLLDYWIIYKKSIKSLVCWSHLDSYRRVFVCLFLSGFFSAGLLTLNFNDTLVSSTHTFPVNIFNLEGGETMLAQDKGNFHALGKNWTHDPPNTTCLSDVPTTEPEGREFDSCRGHGNFLCPGRAWFLLLPRWKCSLEMYVCCSLVYH